MCQFVAIKTVSFSKRLPTFCTAVTLSVCVAVIRALRSMFSTSIGVPPLTRPADVFPPCDVWTPAVLVTCMAAAVFGSQIGRTCRRAWRWMPSRASGILPAPGWSNNISHQCWHLLRRSQTFNKHLIREVSVSALRQHRRARGEHFGPPPHTHIHTNPAHGRRREKLKSWKLVKNDVKTTEVIFRFGSKLRTSREQLDFFLVIREVEPD